MASPTDPGQNFRRAIREALAEGFRLAEGAKVGPTNIAAAVNIGSDGQSTSVYSDQDVTIVQRDGQTRVIHHRDAGSEGTGPGEA